jgi:hypothetical protein
MVIGHAVRASPTSNRHAERLLGRRRCRLSRRRLTAALDEFDPPRSRHPAKRGPDFGRLRRRADSNRCTASRPATSRKAANRVRVTIRGCPTTCGGWWSGSCGGQGSAREPRGSRRAGAAAEAVLPPLQLRPADPGRRHALLGSDLSGVRANLGARHAAQAVREPAHRSADGHVLRDGAWR